MTDAAKARLRDAMLARIRAAENIHVVGISATEGAGVVRLLWQLGKSYHGHDFSTASKFKKTLSTAHYGMPQKKRDALLAKIWADKKKISFRERYLAGVGEADLIFVGQNWRAYAANTPLVKLYEKDPARFVTITDLYFTLFPGRILAITGTNGKSTTSRLTADIMRASRQRSFFTGNDRRNEQIVHRYDKWTKNDWLVIEVSNRQLARSLPRAPDVGVILNVTQNHLDEYGNNFEKYSACKYRLVEKQSRGDIAILNADDPVTALFAKRVGGGALLFSPTRRLARGVCIDSGQIVARDQTTKKILPVDKIRLIGTHNLGNVLAAIAATRQAGVDMATIRHVVSRFRGLPQRLELVAQKRGVLFVDDSVSTTPESSIAAIQSFPEKTVHLIAGGDTKGMRYDGMGAAFARLASVTLLDSPAARAMKKVVPKTTPQRVASTFEEAVRAAFSSAQKGDVVLLSPAAAFFIYFGEKIPGGSSGFGMIAKKL